MAEDVTTLHPSLAKSFNAFSIWDVYASTTLYSQAVGRERVNAHPESNKAALQRALSSMPFIRSQTVCDSNSGDLTNCLIGKRSPLWILEGKPGNRLRRSCGDRRLVKDTGQLGTLGGVCEASDDPRGRKGSGHRVARVREGWAGLAS